MQNLVWIAALGCLCAPAALAGVYVPEDTVTVHVWKGSNAPGFVYPEQQSGDWGIRSLQERPNFGVAVSGGGYRATTTALGWMRGLFEIGLLPNIRYLSSNSGGSWFNGAFSYSKVPIGLFLGPYITPEQLTPDVCKNNLTAGSYGSVIAQGTIIGDAIAGVLGDLVTTNNGIGGWSDAVSEAFLEPYRLGPQDSSITCLGTNGRVHERIQAAYPNATFLTATPDTKPYPVILGSLYLNTTQTFYPIEFTPLYSGVPALYNDTDPKLGAGFIETVGFNSLPPLTAPNGPVGADGSATLNVKPAYLTPLLQMVGVSSSFVAQGANADSENAQLLTGTERMYYWNLQDYNGTQVAFADGGGIDNTATIPLLRRKVKNILICIASVVSPVNMTSSEWAAGQFDIVGLWGANPEDNPKLQKVNGVPIAVWNTMLHVFPKDDFENFFTTIQARIEAGEPAYYQAEYEIVENKLQAVAGGWTANVLILLNQPVAQWEAQLPQETFQLLNDSRNGEGFPELKSFPLISTFDANYGPELTTLLSQLSAYNIVELQDKIKAMAAGGDADTSTVTEATTTKATPKAAVNGAGATNTTGTSNTSTSGSS